MNIAPSRLKLFLIPIIVLLLGVAVSVVAAQVSYKNKSTESALRFDIAINEMTATVSKGIDQYIHALYAIKGLFVASDAIARNEFEAFINTLDLNKRYPGLSAVSFSERVLDANKNLFMDGVKKDTSVKVGGYPNFTIYPAVKSDEYFPVKYIEPETENAGVLGFNFYSDSARRSAMELARDTGEPQTTSIVKLLPDNALGFLIVIPVYKNGANTSVLEGRRKNLTGFINAVIRIKQFSDSALEAFVGEFYGMKMTMSDITSKTPGNGDFMFKWQTNAVIADQEVNAELAHTHQLVKGGRTWELFFEGEPDFGIAASEARIPLVLLISGIILSIFFTITLYVSLHSRLNAVNLADEMVAKMRLEEEKFKIFFDKSADAIFIHDLSGKFLEVNGTACKRLGYTKEELLNMGPTKIDSTKFAKFIPARMAELKANGSAVFESEHIAKDGHEVPVEINATIIDYLGQSAVMSVARDITKRKTLEEDLKSRNADLERMNQVMVNRELKMKELKEEIQKLK